MQCPSCSTELPNGAQFCGKCGYRMSSAGAPPPPPMGFQGPPMGGPPPSYQADMGGGYTPFVAGGQYPGGIPGYQEPVPEVHNPDEPIILGDMTIRIEGNLVPVVDVELGQQQTIYFEHHILLWKHPNVRLGMKGIKGAAKRMFAGLQIFISEAHGPGNVAFSREAPGQIAALTVNPGQQIDVREHQFLLASSNLDYGFYFQKGLANIFFSRSGGLFIDTFKAPQAPGVLLLHGYGNVFTKTLAPGETIDVEPGAWLWKDASVQMTTTTVLQSSGGGGLLGAIGSIVGGFSLVFNRFTGPGRLGIQSMTYHPPTAEGQTQTGGSDNIGINFGS